jgi:hypothetical protein
MHQFILRHIFLSKLHSHKHLLLLGERDTDVGLHGLSGLLSHGAGDVDSANRDGGGSSELELFKAQSSNLTTKLNQPSLWLVTRNFTGCHGNY